MEFKDDAAKAEYDKGWEVNKDEPYGARCFTYATEWADMMEAQMAKGKQIADIAAKTSHDADTDGITGFMYGMAVSILSQTWKHGEELRRWHNLKTQIRDEGEKANESGGVLNPAILNIG